jgi:hypothetical protein
MVIHFLIFARANSTQFVHHQDFTVPFNNLSVSRNLCFLWESNVIKYYFLKQTNNIWVKLVPHVAYFLTTASLLLVATIYVVTAHNCEIFIVTMQNYVAVMRTCCNEIWNDVLYIVTDKWRGIFNGLLSHCGLDVYSTMHYIQM